MMLSSLLAALVGKLIQENIMTHFNIKIDTNSDKTAQLRSLTVIIKQAVKQIIPE